MEKYCLKKLAGSPYVIEFIDSFSDEFTLYIQMELVDGGELWQRIKTFGAIGVPVIRYYLMHLINALESIH